MSLPRWSRCFCKRYGGYWSNPGTSQQNSIGFGSTDFAFAPVPRVVSTDSRAALFEIPSRCCRLVPGVVQPLGATTLRECTVIAIRDRVLGTDVQTAAATVAIRRKTFPGQIVLCRVGRARALACATTITTACVDSNSCEAESLDSGPDFDHAAIAAAVAVTLLLALQTLNTTFLQHRWLSR